MRYVHYSQRMPQNVTVCGKYRVNAWKHGFSDGVPAGARCHNALLYAFRSRFKSNHKRLRVGPGRPNKVRPDHLMLQALYSFFEGNVSVVKVRLQQVLFRKMQHVAFLLLLFDRRHGAVVHYGFLCVCVRSAFP